MEEALKATGGVFTQDIYNLKEKAWMYHNLDVPMFGSAASILACHWKYGDKFHEFHKKQIASGITHMVNYSKVDVSE